MRGAIKHDRLLKPCNKKWHSIIYAWDEVKDDSNLHLDILVKTS